MVSCKCTYLSELLTQVFTSISEAYAKDLQMWTVIEQHLYQQADIRTIPDNDTDQIQQRVKGQAVRRSERSTGHKYIDWLCNIDLYKRHQEQNFTQDGKLSFCSCSL